ncbi:MAG: hypothetical protein WAU88_14560 [Candidatus Zixiibacteriota bacterium]
MNLSKHLIGIVLILALIFAAGSARCASISTSEFDVRFDRANHLLAVTDIVTMQIDSGDHELTLLFSSRNRLDSIIESSKNSPVKFVRKGVDTLIVTATENQRIAGTTMLRFVYAVPLAAEDSVLILLDRGHRWYPMIPDNVVSTELKVQVPKEFGVVACGDLVAVDSLQAEATYRWKSAIPIFKNALVLYRRDRFVDALAPHSGEGLVRLISSTLSDSERAAVIKHTSDVLHFACSTIGPYPHTAYTVLEIPGMDGSDVGSGLVMVGSEPLKAVARGETEALDLVTIQQWLGAGAFGQFLAPGFWFFCISIPHYERMLYVRQISGSDLFERQLTARYQKYKEVAGSAGDAALLTIDYPNTREKGLVCYAKGPYVLNQVRLALGDSLWTQFAATLYATGKGKVVTYGEFVGLLGRFDASGKAREKLERGLTETGPVED